MYIETLEKYNFDIDKIKKQVLNIIDNVGLHEHHNQISLKHTGNFDYGNLWYQGTGSLKYSFGGESDPKERKEKILTQSDFNVLHDEIKDTYLAYIHDELSKEYHIGRYRIMAMKHKKVMSIHTDTTKRIHIPVVTNENCLMMIERIIHHMPADGHAYLADTTKPHTAFNADHKLLRLHLLFDLVN